MQPATVAATTVTTTTAAHAAAMEAKRVFGPTVHLGKDEFQQLLDRIEAPLLVYHHRKRALFVSEAHRYLVGFCGLVFLCRSSEPIELPDDAEVIRAKTFA